MIDEKNKLDTILERQDKLYKEDNELFEKMLKIEYFLNSKKANEIRKTERNLLEVQFQAMRTYHQTLRARINVLQQDNLNLEALNERKTITAEEIAANPKKYYGARVTNYTQGANYRIFYVDTAGKYGDGANTVYLIADYDANRTSALGTYSNRTYRAYDYDTNKTKIRQMNPMWAEYIGNLAENSWNENAKSVAYLCDTSKWEAYCDSTQANYAIGGPSIEMYADSYNQTHNSNSLVYTCTPTTGTSSTNNVKGYFIGANGSYSSNGWRIANNTIDTAQNEIYMNTNTYTWLASLSAYDTYFVSNVNGNGARVSFSCLNHTYGVRPLVSLKSNIPIMIVL